jgi:hypothetical protein
VILLASAALTKTIGLIITFGGIGLVVNALIVYIVVQVLGEFVENRKLGRERDLGPSRG